jgi:hypothetical protein
VTQETYETGGVIENGRLQLEGKLIFEQAMKRFPNGHVTVRISVTKKRRSSSQNRYYHGVVIPLFAEHCGYELSEMKDALALHLIPHEIVDVTTGEVRIVPGHTSELSVSEFNDLIERAQRLGAEMNIYIPDAGEYQVAS